MVFSEAEFVIERMNREEASRAVLVNMAVSALLDKGAAKEFGKQIKKMTNS